MSLLITGDELPKEADDLRPPGRPSARREGRKTALLLQERNPLATTNGPLQSKVRLPVTSLQVPAGRQQPDRLLPSPEVAS